MTLLRDVTLRDGLQDERPIDTADKLALYEALVASGITELELTSFVRPDRVPAMADADKLTEIVVSADPQGPLRWGLVLNERGAERALVAGLRHLQFVVSVSEAHNLENTGRTVAQSLEELRAIAALSTRNGAVLEATLATAFGCPFDGPVAPRAVLDVADRVRSLGVDRMTVADTIGTAVPTDVRALVRALRRSDETVQIGVHLHDTRGLAIANALSAMEEGVDRVDGTVGGLGGCPFAPGASGNMALEDLVHALEAMGVPTGIDLDALVQAARLACGLVGKPVGSSVGVAGPRFAGTPYASSR